jgi:hypothetical protein
MRPGHSVSFFNALSGTGILEGFVLTASSFEELLIAKGRETWRW